MKRPATAVAHPAPRPVKKKSPHVAKQDSSVPVESSSPKQPGPEPLARRAGEKSVSSHEFAPLVVPGHVQVIDVENSPTQLAEQEDAPDFSPQALMQQTHRSIFAPQETSPQAQRNEPVDALVPFVPQGHDGEVASASKRPLNAHIAMGVGRGAPALPPVAAWAQPGKAAVLPYPPKWPPPRLNLRRYPVPVESSSPMQPGPEPLARRAGSKPDGASSSSDSVIALLEDDIARLEQQHAALLQQMRDEERAFCLTRHEREKAFLEVERLLSEQHQKWRQQEQRRQQQQQHQQQQQQQRQPPAAADAAAAPEADVRASATGTGTGMPS